MTKTDLRTLFSGWIRITKTDDSDNIIVHRKENGKLKRKLVLSLLSIYILCLICSKEEVPRYDYPFSPLLGFLGCKFSFYGVCLPNITLQLYDKPPNSQLFRKTIRNFLDMCKQHR